MRLPRKVYSLGEKWTRNDRQTPLDGGYQIADLSLPIATQLLPRLHVSSVLKQSHGCYICNKGSLPLFEAHCIHLL
jgi:hypothetical protein